MADKIVDTWNDYSVCPTCSGAWFSGTEAAYGLTFPAWKWIKDHRTNYTFTVLGDLAHFGRCDICDIEGCVFDMTLNKWA